MVKHLEGLADRGVRGRDATRHPSLVGLAMHAPGPRTPVTNSGRNHWHRCALSVPPGDLVRHHGQLAYPVRVERRIIECLQGLGHVPVDPALDLGDHAALQQ